MKAIAFWAEAAKVDIEVDSFVLLKGVKVRTLLRRVGCTTTWRIQGTCVL